MSDLTGKRSIDAITDAVLSLADDGHLDPAIGAMLLDRLDIEQPTVEIEIEVTATINTTVYSTVEVPWHQDDDPTAWADAVENSVDLADEIRASYAGDPDIEVDDINRV